MIKKMPSLRRPKIISLFSGCGGMDLGFKMAGYETIWANDFNEWACETYKKNFGGHIQYGSITDIDPYSDKSIPSCDLVLGGFPCQDFSIIWKQPGLKGSRGNLYKHFLKFVDAKKPKAFVAENVKGILTANNGKAIKQIVKDFSEISPGYVIKIQLYNFAEYGVPQFRERVLIVGVRKNTKFNFVHPAPTHGPKGSQPYVTAGEAIKGALKVPYNNEHMNINPNTRKKLDLIPEGGNFSDIPVNHPLYTKGMISHVYRRIHRKEPAKTIIAAGGGGTWGYHFPEPRALTNRERARLQSFPDNFVFMGSPTEVRRQIGNAVPPTGVFSLAKALYPLFQNNYNKVNLDTIDKELNNLSIKDRIKFDQLQLVQVMANRIRDKIYYRS